MKKVILISIALLALSTICSAQVASLSLDWSYDGSGVGWSASRGAYNFSTDHFVICDYAAPAVRIASGADGTLTGGTLDLTGLNLHSTLGVFGICVARDGVIYGGTGRSTAATDDSGNSLIRWENESATPTQQDPTPLEGTELTFVRTMDVRNTGVDTLICVIGANYDAPQILTTTNGTDFAITDIGLGPDADIGVGKSGVAVNSDGTRVYGSQADGNNFVRRQDKVDGTWELNTTFSDNVDVTDLPTAIGYGEGINTVFALETHGATEDTTDMMVAIDGDFGNEVAEVDPGVLIARWGYGKCDIDEDNMKVYFAARGSDGSDAGGYAVGVVSYTTPTPTPIILEADMSWGLYE